MIGWARWSRDSRSRLTLLSLLLSLVIASCAPTAGRIELSETESDWGTVSNRAVASRDYEVRNTGTGPLEITGVSTSCGCTMAQVGDRKLEPGETTVLKVTYDPQVHNGATGDFLRMVYVRSDDPDTPEAALSIWLTVVEQ
jgi:hypothetical protein